MNDRPSTSTNQDEDTKLEQKRSEIFAIENVTPEINGGRFCAKRVVGDIFEVQADIFKPGNDIISASLKYRKSIPNDKKDHWFESPMTSLSNDRFVGSFQVAELGTYQYTIECWTDRFSTRLREIQKWAGANEDVSEDLRALFQMVDAIRLKTNLRERLDVDSWLKRMKSASRWEDIQQIVEDQKFRHLIQKHDKSDLTSYKILGLVVDPPRARFSTWYEMFHRSQGTIKGKSATFKDCEKRLAEIHQMGFDIIYLPPIHPIGHTNRRGKNNETSAKPSEPGSPWAIGNESGGHTSVNPELGTVEDLLHFVKSAKAMGMEIALDLAFQCSPDHPYVKEHPEWFLQRSDGTIRYAENPPKRYYDIYPLFFESKRWKELWKELLNVVLFWVGHGINIFRVDNPHTKPLGFWEWLIAEVKKESPETIFLAEAFTRPNLMHYLAKLGFSQSYTYFTWKNSKWELGEFLNEFTGSEASEYYRGNFFTNSPDILSGYLQRGGRSAFKIRLVLAATLSSVYGIYNGYELCENRAKAPDSEEYLDSEKYQYKVWDWNRPGNIKDFITKINRIRVENPSLHFNKNLKLLRSDNDNIFFYAKWNEDRSNIILVVVNLDPFATHDSTVFVPIKDLNLQPWETYTVHDLITNASYRWRGEANYVKLDPNIEPAHILLLER